MTATRAGRTTGAGKATAGIGASLRQVALVAALAAGTALASGLAQPVRADSYAGAYLAGRHANYFNDYEKAAEYFSQALSADPANPNLLESAISMRLGMGQVDQAAALGERLRATGVESQLASLALLARAVAQGDFGTIFGDLEAGHTIGPLVDGLGQAWAHVGQGSMSDALDAFDEVADTPGLRPFGLYHKALALASVGDYEGAAEIFALTPRDGMEITRRGTIAYAQILSQLDRPDEAIALIDRVFGAALDPGLHAMRARLKAGEPQRFSYVTSAREGMAEIFFSVAGALNGEIDDHYTLIYTRLTEYLAPSHVEALLMSAALCEALGRHDLAIAAYGTVDPAHPAYHAAELGRASALQRTGRIEEAVEVLEALTETHFEVPEVHIRLGDSLRRLSRYDQAEKAYGTALSLYDAIRPSQWRVFYARGVTRERMGDWDAAEADFRQALELNPDQPQVLNYLGYSLVEKRAKLDEALSLIERAVSADPTSGYIVDSLGWALFQMGRFEDAVVHMERAAELEPTDPVINDHLGDAYWSVGREAEARFQWQRALSFDTDQEISAELRRKLAEGPDQLRAEVLIEVPGAANDGG